MFAIGAPAAAGEFNPLGDGSETNNIDLLRDPTTGCENCAPAAPHDWNEPFFDLDWSLALRGSYVQATGGSYFEAVAIPEVTLRHETLRGGFEVSASAEVTRSTLEGPRLAAARAALEGDYRLDSTTAVGGALNLSMTQASASAPGTPPTVAVQPVVLAGDGEITGSKQFGSFVVSGRANASRTVYGPTTLVDSSTVDNSHQSNWTLGGGLRLGYEVTPVLTAFVDASLGQQRYDAASPVYLVLLDATDYQARAGLSADWNGVLEAEASVGYGVRRFVDPSLGEAGSLLYDASLIYRPDETVEARAAFSTRFGAPGPGNGGTARLEYAADADIAYVVNPWLTLRAGAGWSQAQFIGTPDSETTYDAGVGADYVLNEFSTLTADYAFSHRDATTGPAESQHRVTLGVTLSR